MRESVSWSREQSADLLRAMSESGVPGIPLSTCNRSEFYFLETDSQDGARLREVLPKHFSVSPADLDQYLYEFRGYDAVHHLFRVASGLDSMILGEDQIIGQVRQAYQAAKEQGEVPGLLSRLFQQSFRVGRKVRRESGVGRHALSVGRACVDLAKLVVGDLTSSSVLVVGAGEAGETAAEALSFAGARDITVVNRTYSRAAELALRLSGRAAGFDELPEALAGSDIVIGCTGSPGYVVQANMVDETMASRPDRPLFLIDIAVPRDIDPEAGKLRNVSLCDIDDLESVSKSGRQHQAQEAEVAEGLASEEAWAFERWRRSLESLPPVIDVRQRAEDVRRVELERTLKRLNGKLTDEERDSLEAMTRAIVNKLLHSPTVYLKEQTPPVGRQAAEDIFGVEPEPERS